MTTTQAAITRALEVASCHGAMLEERLDAGEALNQLALVVDERRELVFCCSLGELEQTNPRLAWTPDQWPRVILLLDGSVAWVPIEPRAAIECTAPGGTA